MARILAYAALVFGCTAVFTIDDTVCSTTPSACRALDGIGGLSGGGATSVFLPSYAEPAKSDILECVRLTSHLLLDVTANLASPSPPYLLPIAFFSNLTLGPRFRF